MSDKRQNILIYSFSGLLIVTLIVVGSSRYSARNVHDIAVEIIEEDGVYFTDKLEVIDLLTENNTDYIIGVSNGELDIKMLESRIESNPFIHDAQVYLNIKGLLNVKVSQSKPIARFLNQKSDNYIDIYGNILPVNAKHTARVPLVESELGLIWDQNLNETKYGTQILQFLKYIAGDDFWRAQIAQIVILKNGEMELYPQVTKQVISFGHPQNIEKKLSRLMTFYKKVLPQKGWNTYARVNVKFENQIICE